MTSPLIRRARPGDEAAIHEAHMRSIREICVKDHGEEEIRGWGYRPLGDRWVRAIREDFVQVVELDGKIQGFGHIRVLEENGIRQANLHALYLTPEVIGRGQAQKLMENMLSYAKAGGAKTVILGSSLTAHNFYKRFGFQDSGPMQRADIGGHPVRSHPMILRFSEEVNQVI